jgi:hypothetical protein
MTKARDKQAKSNPLATSHADGGTRRPENPALEGRIPLPEELTGRASGTDDDLVALFDNTTGDHIADGFRGGSDDEAVEDLDDVVPELADDVEEPLDRSDE